MSAPSRRHAAKSFEAAQGRDARVRFVIWIEGAVNVLALAIKLIVGISTGSFAIIADALHSVTDVANNVVALVVMHFAGKPPDHDHPYGHRKFETLAVFVLATLLTVLAVEIALHALRAETREVVDSTAGLVAMLTVLALVTGVTLWQAKMAKVLESDLLHADARHTLSDVFLTLAVIVGWQFSAAGYGWADTVTTVAVAAVVLWFAIDLFRRVIPVLVDERAHEPDAVREAAATVDGVIDVLTVRSRSIGSDSAIDVVVTVHPDLRMTEAHHIADAVEEALHQRFPAAFVFVHVEPDETDPKPASPA